MKRFWGFVLKEFFHIFRDKRTLVIMFGLPIAQILLFGYVITNEIKNVKIAILDKSKDEVTRKITSKILSSGYFQLDKYLNTESEIEGVFKQGRVREVIIFENNFGANLQKKQVANIQILADASDANLANLVVNYSSGIIRNYQNELNQLQNSAFQIVPESRMVYNEELKGVFMFIPGIMAMILILISALLTSISIVREKELGTMEILLVSPLRPIQIIIGKVAPYLLLSIANAVIIILLGKFVFDVPVQGSIILLFAECMLYIFMSLSLGILISSITTSQQTAMMISMFALMLPTILLSGFIFPIENMPLVLQWFCQIMPPKYFIIIVKSIMIKGSDFSFIWKETLIIAGMTLFFILVSVKKFKIRLE
jgi:ABC-2 type transport system permease protein